MAPFDPKQPNGSRSEGQDSGSTLPAPAWGGGDSSALLPAVPGRPAGAAPGPFALTGEDPGGEFHLKDALATIVRHRWLFVGVTLLIFLLAAFRTFSKTPLYEAGATIRIEHSTSNIVGLEDIGGKYDPQRFYDTHYQMLRRRSLALATLEELGLVERFVESMRNAEPGIFETLVSGIRSLLGTSALKAEEESYEDLGREAAIDWLTTNLFVRPTPDSELVKVVFTSADPELCARVANELARQYVAENIRNRSAAYAYASEFLERELKESQARLEEYEEEMREYSGGRDELALTQRQEIATKRLNELGQSLATAEREVLVLKAEIDRANAEPKNSERVMSSDLIQGLLLDINRTKLDYEMQAEELGTRNPELQRMERRLELLQTQFDDAVHRVLEILESNYNIAVANYEQLKDAYDKQSKFVTQLEDSLLQYRIMAQQTESERDTYQRLLDRSKEINIQKGLAINNVQVVEPAVPPRNPTYPRIGRNMILGAIAALMIGLGTVFFVEYMDRSLKSPEEIEQFVGIPCLAVIPSISARDIKAAGKESPLALATALLPNSNVAETFRYIRTAVVYSMPGRIPQVMVVSSSLPSEGKTTVSINTAAAFAQRGAHVLVVDGDLKRPACHKVFNVDRRMGLTALLTGQASMNDVIFQSEIEGLDFMPAGPLTPNPADLLDSPVMRDTLEALRRRYDHIFIDSAPLAGMADTYILSSMSDGLIMVVEAGRTPRDLVAKIRAKLESVNVNILGAVLNARRSKGRRIPAVTGYDYSYTYGYTYSYGPNKPEVAQVRPSQTSTVSLTGTDDAPRSKGG